MKIKKFNENVNPVLLSEEDAHQLFGEIDNQGFGYWIQNYGYEDSKTDPQLVKLCEEARTAMNKLDRYIRNIFDSYGIG